MSKLVCLLLVAFLATTSVLGAEKTCSPWLGYCQVYDQCCRDLECSTYQLKCVPILGIKIPGKDQRPIGPGPFPPQVQYSPYKYPFTTHRPVGTK